MKNTDAVVRQLKGALARQPIFDVHTHLDAGHLTARGLHDVLLYHMVVSDLYAAGCPSGTRLSESPDQEETAGRIIEAIPYLQHTANTSCRWGLGIILKDLYGWKEPITLQNWRRLDGIIRERAGDKAWARQIMDRARVVRASTELARRGDGQHDDILQYSLESAFFARVQWGQNDAPLYELENAWASKVPPPPLPVTLDAGTRPKVKPVKTVRDVKAAMAHYCRKIPYDRVISTAQHISTDIDYRPVSDKEMAAALARRARATEADRDVYAGYLLCAFLEELSKYADKIVFQFSLGAEPLPLETSSRLNQRTLAQLAQIVARFPRLRFQCFLSSRHANQTLCTMVRELPNLSLAGYWWHNFFPDAMRQVMSERLDMLPTNRQMGFFSDAYCMDWMYAKAAMVRMQLLIVLTQRICQGQYTLRQAIEIAGQILYRAPRDVLGMKEGLPG